MKVFKWAYLLLPLTYFAHKMESFIWLRETETRVCIKSLGRTTQASHGCQPSVLLRGTERLMTRVLQINIQMWQERTVAVIWRPNPDQA